MNNKFEPLQSGEVLSVNQSNQFLIEHNTFRTSEFTEALQHKMIEQSVGGLTEGKVGWLTEEGIECEVLRFGSNGWQKGKVRIYLEFCPDESIESNVSASNASDTRQTTVSESPNQDLDDFSMEEDNFSMEEDDFSMEEDNFSMEEEDLGFEAQVSADETQSTDMASSIDDEFSLEETVDNQNGLTLEDNLDNSEDALDLGDFAEDTDKLTFSDFESNNESENGQDENSFDDVWEDINQPI